MKPYGQIRRRFFNLAAPPQELCLAVGKTRYRSRAVAEKMARRLEQFRVEKLRVYRCKKCKWWHLTKRGET